MHICFLTRSQPAHRDSEQAFHQMTLGRRLAERGHNVKIITTSREDGVEKTVKDGVEILYLSGTKPDSYSEDFSKRSYGKILEINQTNSVDIVANESAAGAGYAKQRKRTDPPMVSILHNTPLSILYNESRRYNFFSPKSTAVYLSKIYRNMRFYYTDIRHCYKNSELIIPVSKQMEKWARLYPSIDSNTLTVIQNGIDTTMFQPLPESDYEDVMSKIGVSEDEFVLLYLGRLSPEKGIEYAIRAVPKLINSNIPVKLIIAGPFPGSNGKRLEKLTEKLNIGESIKFVGGIKHQYTPLYYNICDIYILPSLRDTSPFTIREAQACGIPVIASEVGGIPDCMIDEGTGILTQPKNVNELSGNITELYNDEKKRKDMGENAREYIKREQSLSKMAKKYEEKFESILRLH
jgi:glycosyltransferase involved in cell wall biosynthesis